MQRSHLRLWAARLCAVLWLAVGLRAAVPTEEALLESALDPQASVVERTRAFTDLRALATERATPALSPLLPDPAWSYSARAVLETIPGAAADRALIAALGTVSDAALQAGLLSSIGGRALAGAVPAVTKFLSSVNPAVVRSALGALGDIGTASAGDALKAFKPSADSRALHADAMLRVAERLQRTDSRGASELYRAVLASGSPPQVAAATVGLARLSSEPAKAIARAVASADFSVRHAALAVVRGGELGPALTIELGNAFSAFAPDLQVQVLSVLYDRRDRGAAPVARVALRADDVNVQAAAARLLSVVGDPEDAPALLRLMIGPDEPAPSARLALSRIQGEATTTLLVEAFRAGGEARPAVLEVLVRRGHRPLLADLLQPGLYAEPEFGSVAASALLALASGGHLGAVLELHRDLPPEGRGLLEPPLRRIAAKHDSPDQAAALVAAAAEKLPLVEASPLYLILAAIGGDEAFGPLTTMLQSPLAATREVALRALSYSGEVRAGPALVAVARDEPDPAVRTVAVQAARLFFARIAAPGATPPVDVIAAAVAGLRETWSLAEQPREKAAVLTALRSLKHATAIAAAAELETSQPAEK